MFDVGCSSFIKMDIIHKFSKTCGSVVVSYFILFIIIICFPQTGTAWLSSETEQQLEGWLFRFGSPLPSGARPYRIGELQIILEDLKTRPLSPYAAASIKQIEQQLKNGFNRLEITGIAGNEKLTRLHDEGIALEETGGEIFGQLNWKRQGIAGFIEPSFQTTNNQLELHRGEIAFEKWNLQSSIGKNRLFWGHGHHTSLMFSDRSEPLPQIQIASIKPFRIPYLPFFGKIKPRLIYSQLDETDRSLPDSENFGFTERSYGREKPSLWGERLDFYYSPNFEWSMGRVTMFGGDGTTADYTLKDWLHTLVGSDHAIQEPGGERNGGIVKSDSNGLLFIEAKARLPGLAKQFNWEGVTAYLDYGADDLRHDNYPPLNLPRPAAGFQLRGIRIYPNKKSSWIIEYANVKVDYFRIYQHGIYEGGHTYKGRWLGHFLGSDSNSLFIRYDRETTVFGYPFKPFGELFWGKTLNKRYEAPERGYVPGEPTRMKIMWGALGGDVLISKNIRLNSTLQHERHNYGSLSDERKLFTSLLVQMEISF